MTFVDLVEQLRMCFLPVCLDDYPGEFGHVENTVEPITHVGYATNLTPSTVANAVAEGVNAILTHHDAWDFLYELREEVFAALKSAGISHAFVHLPLDAAPFGTAATLARRLKLQEKKAFAHVAGLPCGRICDTVYPLSLDELVSGMMSATGAGIRVFRFGPQSPQRIGITTGGGNLTDVLREAADMGCDTYITGESNLYTVQYARHRAMNLLIGTHTHTEFPGVQSLCEKLHRRTGLRFVPLRETDIESGILPSEDVATSSDDRGKD